MAKLQSAKYDCSIAAIQNALRVFGVRAGYKRVLSAMEPIDVPTWDIKDGGDEDDIKRALDALGFGYFEFESNRGYEARGWIQDMAPNMPLILCVDDWGHWVTVAGVCRHRYLLQDPELKPHNTAELGVKWLKNSTICRRWRASRKRRKEGELYYGIAVRPG